MDIDTKIMKHGTKLKQQLGTKSTSFLKVLVKVSWVSQKVQVVDWQTNLVSTSL